LKKQTIFHANNLINKRLKRVPLAYILGQKEFYGRDFIVNKHTLVPRPESEANVDLFKKVMQDQDFLIDVGTGSGILAITCALEALDNDIKLQVFASDISSEALKTAKLNAANKKLDITFLHSDLLQDISQEILNNITIVVANLPYVDKEWINQAQPNELHHEPQNALYTQENGLELIYKLIAQTKTLPQLKHIILEADPEQHKSIIAFAQNHNLELVGINDYCILLKTAL
ncbi:MAG: HemK family protein methyltransferase, partial [Candidatus Sacchiramonaceae bacterium]|nr:HemK family protein methyltransferase [Candidatus Saccharimonadaceae bacterium]